MAVLLLLFMSMHANAALIQFTDRAQWETAAGALGTITTDNFDYDAIADNQSIDLASNINSTTAVISGGGLGLGMNRTTGTTYQGRIGTNSDHPDTIIWEFPEPTLGFFGNFSAIDESLTVMVDNLTFDIVDGLFGITSDTAFTSLSWGSGFTSELFRVDDFSFVNGDASPSPPSAVPVPAAIWLFGTGLLGLVGFSKRRKAS